MKIGIDCRLLGPENGGLGRYVEQLVTHLAGINNDHRFVLFLNKNNFSSVGLNNLDSRFKKTFADIPWYGWEEQIKFKSIIDRETVDIMHFPHWNIPLMYSAPYVATIHDLIMYHYPRPDATTRGKAVYAIKDKLHRLVVRHTVASAKRVIAVSEFTKDDIRKTLGVSADKISVVYGAPYPETVKLKADSEKENIGRLGITKPFVLYVGSAYPHKNLANLVDAWRVLQEKFGYDFQLVLAGSRNKFYERLIDEKKIGSWNDIVPTGFVSDALLSALYKRARLYVFPSLYEGFGLPPLEAMAQGVPVAASNRSCLPEVLGEAALYFDPENPEQMAEVIQLGLTDDDIRFDLRQKSKEELKRYSWEATARKTLEILVGAVER
ncbi:MAG: glycosyltransferase family 1 protein [Patescibacteria group bacterium]